MTALHVSPGTRPNGSPCSDAPVDELWELVIRRLRPLHEASACREYLEAFPRLLGDAGRIPSLPEVSARLHRLTGFRIERADGAVAPRAFLAALARRVLVATPTIRSAESPFFTPTPDWIHDVVGHAVFLAHPRGAELYELFGRACRPTTSDDEVARLTRLFWCVAEAGAVREHGEWKALGGALLSSVEELEAFPGVAVSAFEPELAADVPFDDSRCQRQVCGARSVEELHVRLQRHFGLARSER